VVEKYRVHQISKELGVKSERIIEKLREINIIVKNHMSYIDEEQRQRLFDSFGMKRPEEKQKPVQQPVAQPQEKTAQADSSSAKQNAKKHSKSGPVIIRTTQIILDSQEQPKKDNKPAKEDQIVSEAGTGLKTGFVKKEEKLLVNKDVEQEPKKEASLANEQISEIKAQETQEVQQRNIGIEKPEGMPKAEQQQKQQENEQEKKEKERFYRQNQQHTENKNNKAEFGRNTPEHRAKTDVKKNKDGKNQDWQSKNKKPSDLQKQKTDNKPKPDRADKPLDIFVPEIPVKKDEPVFSRVEPKKDFIKDFDDEDEAVVKKEPRKDVAKILPGMTKEKKFKPKPPVLNQKKGVSEVLSEDFLDTFYEEEEVVVKKAKKPAKQKKQGKDARGQDAANDVQPKHEVLTNILLPESITVKELAEAMKKTAAEVMKKLMSYGVMAAINQQIDYDTAALVAEEFGITAERLVEVNEEEILFDESEDKPEDLKPRPPVVVVMGHVDHGKTSLLDRIRKTNVTDYEAGGITQHIGAYTVKINERSITFLDTPGHEAFTAMRARGAQVTDIAILVVAADDGVMPQTVEAINHAKAANVSIIVAINKIDKPDANPERVKQELTEYGLVPEEWGGDVICVPVSAKTGENIELLLEMVLLTADILELKANPDKQAKGTIIEAKLDKSRGPIATLLVQRGTLKVGDAIVTGVTFGRIRAMIDDKGNSIKSAPPSTPVEVLGLPEVPEAGEVFYVVKDEKLAKQVVEKRKEKQREQALKQAGRISLDDLFNQIQQGKVKDLNIIVKADVQGSVEAVKQSLEKLSTDEVRVKIIHGGVGAVTESDVKLAEVSNAIIIGFNVRPAPNVPEIAENANVDIRLYRVIYNAIEDVQAAMKGMLEPKYKEVILGHAEIRQLYKVSGVGTVGGAYVTDGKIVRSADVRIVRNGIVVHEGKLASLKRFKDDVREVMQGYECGLSIEKFNDIKEGDIVEAFEMQKIEQ